MKKLLTAALCAASMMLASCATVPAPSTGQARRSVRRLIALRLHMIGSPRLPWWCSRSCRRNVLRGSSWRCRWRNADYWPRDMQQPQQSNSRAEARGSGNRGHRNDCGKLVCFR